MNILHILLVLIASVAECLMLSRVLVPQYKLVGEEALLKCDYDLGRDRLYAVKWYKDNEEFFRYVPRFNPPIYTHPVEGVRVESSKSNDKRVLLRSLSVRSTGVYRCEMFFIKYGPRGDIIGESSGLTSLVPSSIGAVSATIAHSSHTNGDIPSESVDVELEHDLHNASTLLASEKQNGVRKKNLDSIERFDDHNSSDDVDATKLSYLDLPKVPFHGGKGGGVSDTDEVRHNDKGTKKNDDDDCTVKCLYYTLMCCECSIS